MGRLGLTAARPQAPSAVRAATLSVADIPEHIAPLPAHMNTALTGPCGTPFRRWQRQLLRSMLASAPEVFLIADSAQAMEQLLAVPDLQEALAQSRIRPWILPVAMQTQIAAHKLSDFLSELHTAGLRPHHALLCTNATGLLQQAHLPQLERMTSQWRHWAKTRQQASVWCFTVDAEHSYIRPIISTLSRCFLYVAHLEIAPANNALVLERWDSPQGALFHTRYGLSPAADGLLHANGSIERGATARLEQAPDAHAVYVTQACQHSLRTLPTHWIVVENWEAAEEAMRSATAATLLLDTGMPTQFEAIASLIYRLRSTHPSTLKIAVLETNAKLRTYHELALLQLGANEVFYAEMRTARIVRHLQALEAQVYRRDLPADWQGVLQDFLPVPEHGYQSPSRFAELVRTMLDSAKRQGLSHTLVQLPLLPHVSHNMALRAYHGTRMGDLVTADAESLWLFLYTCHEVDLTHTLGRVFTPPTTNLFSSHIIHNQLPGIAQQLVRLLESDAQQPLPDYSHILEEHRAKDAHATIATAHHPEQFPASSAPRSSPPAAKAIAPAVSAAGLTWQAFPLGTSTALQEHAP